MELNAYIDHTLLKSTATEKEIINLFEDDYKMLNYEL